MVPDRKLIVGNGTAKTKPKTKPVSLYSGDAIFVVYWHPSDNSHYVVGSRLPEGRWDVMAGRVVAVERLVCFETANPRLPYGGTVDAVDGSPLRFTTPDNVFIDYETARAAAKSRAPLA